MTTYILCRQTGILIGIGVVAGRDGCVILIQYQVDGFHETFSQIECTDNGDDVDYRY